MNNTSIGIRGIAYALPASRRSLSELETLGKLRSEPELLEQFGFAQVCVAEEETPYALALEAASTLLCEHNVKPESVDVLIYCGTPAVAFSRGGSVAAAANDIATTRRFRYPSTRLQYDLGLACASTLALDQLACTSLFASVRMARALIQSGDARRVLCVSAEFFPERAGREAIYNCTADAACAVLVEAGADCNRILASAQTTKGYYWDADSMPNEIVASYFPTAAYVISDVLRRAGWRASDVSLVIPHNVNVRSWEILVGLTGIAEARLWCRNVARIGHTLAGDNFINLRDATDDGSVKRGDRLLLFSYGYGAHWTALALEA
ncbi:MAG TPA: 3-oxoacyl-[acyl-carrier-protein] synthase III C-terminal domain-containing protein [Gemmatimonadaceae bacterium]|jgi:3-oxoacyl-[acyl-carrier-protein] synthase-3